jgi:hypothetical protein
MEKTITLKRLEKELNRLFPKMWTRLEENYIVTGENSFIIEKITDDDDPDQETVTIPMFNYWDEQEILYEMGVHKKLANFLNSYGYYAEAYDPGTYHITKG